MTQRIRTRASMTVDVIEASPDRLEMQGALTFETARRAREAALRDAARARRRRTPLQVDCAGGREIRQCRARGADGLAGAGHERKAASVQFRESARRGFSPLRTISDVEPTPSAFRPAARR